MSQARASSRSPSEASDTSVTGDPFSPQASSVLAASSSTVSEAASSDVTEEQIKYVRAHCDTCAASADDATVRRFIRATGGNLALSIKRLNATCAWRAAVRPEQVVCRACVRDPRSHYMHLCGYAADGRPIIYSCLANPTNKVFEDNKAHMIQTFEWAIKCMPPGVEQWIWVCDFKGFGMADVNPKLAKLFLDISAEHYPERLGMFMIVDAPSLFGLLWKAIQSFVDPKTYKKIRFLPFDFKAGASGGSLLKAEMEQHFDPVTTAWLLREMAENRDKAKVPLKPFNYYSLHQQALSGELCSGGEHALCHHGHLALQLPSTAHVHHTKHHGHQHQHAHSASGQPHTHTQPASGTSGLTAAGGGVGGVAVTADASTRAAAAAASSTSPSPPAGSSLHSSHGGAGAYPYQPHVIAEEAGRLPHNYYGTPAMLHTLNARPDLLLPQATASATA
ncbi:hypothetical protein HYH02_003925 [Chlamydomonas schloesseri]|uniref:CRAL-TRIO domain-containing protein n=1 Tax=Chlamydomonas schloesseri TaxID=2026947 RepID=A0A835WRJ1_9CHLO|nr:hypothetical protein HYH02_003925 [Chlamydomonas schloesseri]|eukprot:KAG2451320.1 hypothetical protein HYH02_003925 [Chlamydomonas schloesseri]